MLMGSLFLTLWIHGGVKGVKSEVNNLGNNALPNHENLGKTDVNYAL